MNSIELEAFWRALRSALALVWLRRVFQMLMRAGGGFARRINGHTLWGLDEAKIGELLVSLGLNSPSFSAFHGGKFH